MRIALVGAPGSGKSELAEALAKELDKETVIVDNYIEEIEKECDLKMGQYGTYIGNLYVLLGRYSRERKNKPCCGNHLITCGTMVETATYASLEAVTKQTDVHWVRIQNMMNILGTFFQDTWKYDHAFVLSVENPDVETHAGKVDRHLFMAINSFGVPYTPLSGSLEEKVAKALKVMEGEEVEAEEADEQ